MIDTHVNLHAESFAADRVEMLDRAREAGVTGFVAICDRLDAASGIADLVADIPDIWHSVGVHPHHAKDFAELEARELRAASAGGKVCALGETGLDYHKMHSPRGVQIRCFEAHIEAARHRDLPLIIHCREAEDDMLAVLERQMRIGPFKLLLHCYTGSAHLAARASEMGAYFSVSGIVTFKNANGVRQVVAGLPHDRLVIETDSPYLAPVPYRGRRNEPAFLGHVCAALADLLGLTDAQTATLTSANARALFSRAFAAHARG